MDIHVTCKCGKRLRVKQQHGGRQGKCPACGTVLDIPNQGDPSVNHGPEDHPGPEIAAPSQTGKPAVCPSCGKGITAKAVICVECGLDLRTGMKLTRETTTHSRPTARVDRRRGHKSCPCCGSSDIARAPRSSEGFEITASGNRECQRCGAIWRPPISRWIAGVFLLFVLPIFLGDLAFLIVSLVTLSFGMAFGCGIGLLVILGGVVVESVRGLLGYQRKPKILKEPEQS